MATRNNRNQGILTFPAIKARRFFLREESYCDFDLPFYFTFKDLLNKVSQKLNGRNLSDFLNIDSQGRKDSPRNYDDVNCKFLNNKDGKFAWRPIQLIHPALYVSLVSKVTEKSNWDFLRMRFEEFQMDERIRCLSVPFEPKNDASTKSEIILRWWHEIEQRSIEYALKYDYVMHTDISDCYGSIYTHSISWALHSKEVAKDQRNDKGLLGNQIDWILQDMSFGQTNGIPQGSALMDFIAEIVLGYADLQLLKRVGDLEEFQILRYRDDYRVFSNNPSTIEAILKQLTEVLIELGMRLNSTKTIISNSIVSDSLKPDKTYWMINRQWSRNLQEQMLIVHDLANRFPNSGALIKELDAYFERINKVKTTKSNVVVLISILTDIAYKNPKSYPVATAILSKLIDLIKKRSERQRVLRAIVRKFEKIPNTGHLQIWLQRITVKVDPQIEYDQKLCKKLQDPTVPVWNTAWAQKSLRDMLDRGDIVDRKKLGKAKPTIARGEVLLFGAKPISSL